jgi:hypothetical protein
VCTVLSGCLLALFDASVIVKSILDQELKEVVSSLSLILAP